MRSVITITTLSFIVIGMGVCLQQATASDLIEIDTFPSLMTWWIHGHDYGLPIKQEIQAYGNVDDQWFILATGPVVKIPMTEIDVKLPVGFKLTVKDPKLPITHWVAKINFIGKIGPLKLTAVHDMSWGRKDENNNQYPNILFIKEILEWNGIGIRMDGLKIGGLGGVELKDKPFSLHLGPFLSYKLLEQHYLQFFLGVNVRNTEQKCLKGNYLFLKF